MIKLESFYLKAMAGFPWIIQAYVGLFLLLLVVLLWSAYQGSHVETVSNALNEKLFTLASDLLKTVVGALIGSLSLAGQFMWQRDKGHDDTPPPDH